MAKKRKDNKNSDKIGDAHNEGKKTKTIPRKLSFKSMIGLLLRMYITITFITVGFIAIFLAYLFVKHTLVPARLPDIDMNKYWGTYPMDPNQDISIRAYKIEFSDVMVNDLRERLLHQRPFQAPLEDSGFTYGFNANYLAKILDFWKNKYDFKGREKFFNKYNHYVTNIQGLDIHYMHVKPNVRSDVKVVTLLLLHSWPGSIREFYEIIPKLISVKHNYTFVFEIIAPSLPGFGFSQAPVRPGMSPTEMAVILSKLMERIDRQTYYVHGGDLGHAVGSALATIFPNNVLGFHTSTPKIYNPMIVVRTMLAFLFPSLPFDHERNNQTFTFKSFVQRLLDETGYIHIQATKPDTIGLALTDSPAGLAAYIMEKFSLLTNPDNQKAEDGNLVDKFSLTQLLDNVMVYWTTNTITPSMRVYAENYDQSHFNLDRVVTEVPTWGLKSKHYLAIAPVSVLRMKYKNYLHSTVMDNGGGFVAMEYPGLLADDIFEAVNTFRDFYDIMHGVIPPPPVDNTENIYEFSATDIHGKEVPFEKYVGHVLLIVNVASECGLTDKNYEQLTQLYDEYEERGLKILAFPCNQFGSQEPGSPQEIIDFTNSKGVRFDVFSKVDVNGDDAHPLWKFLKRKLSGTLGDWIKWNFSKFIIDRNGVPVERFGPDFNPLDLKHYIDKYIGIDNEHEDL